MHRHGGRRGGDGQRSQRGVFTKLMKDKNATMSDKRQAKRFLEGMDTFDSKAELLQKLHDKRENGTKRIGDVLSFINSIHDVQTLLIPLLRHVMNEETGRPVYLTLRNKILLVIFSVPNLMETLLEHDAPRDLDHEAAQQLCSFLRAVAKSFLEPRQSETLHAIAKALRDRGDVDEAKLLCSVLMVDREAPSENFSANSNQNYPEVACWVTDMEPPGDRHNNDHQNYRDIQIIPTVEELRCTVKPYLPLANGQNRVIQDPVAHLLDRNFRLLREDAVSSMRESIAGITESPHRTWKTARIIDLHVFTKGTKWAVSFVIQCDNRQGGNPDWKRSRALMHGSVIALCHDGVPVRLGTVVLREDEIKGEWLQDPSGPKVGVIFETETEFDESIQDVLKNSGVNDDYCKLRTESHQAIVSGRQDPQIQDRLDACRCQLRSFDLVEVSKSFFAYQPILKTLQKMELIPLKEEFVGEESSMENDLNYLPDTVLLPAEFNNYEIDMQEVSVDDMQMHTTLDESQARALHHCLTSSVSLVQG